jgi:hypothetical protein
VAEPAHAEHCVRVVFQKSQTGGALQHAGFSGARNGKCSVSESHP